MPFWAHQACRRSSSFPPSRAPTADEGSGCSNCASNSINDLIKSQINQAEVNEQLILNITII
jgi:hypothetical protein